MGTFRKGWQPTQPNQLVVESYADGAFAVAVAAAHGLPSFEFTTPLGENNRPLGKDGFPEHLQGMVNYIRRDLVRNVAVIGDNDDDHDGAFTRIRRALQDAKGYPTVNRPLEVAAHKNLRVGILMLPATATNGCLETLLLRATWNGGLDPACVDRWVECSGFPTTPRNKYHKFRVRSLLSGCISDAPDIHLSDVWRKTGCPLNPADPEFRFVADFLRDVFV
jgi:hypothetical protein